MRIRTRINFGYPHSNARIMSNKVTRLPFDNMLDYFIHIFNSFKTYFQY